MRKTVSLWLLVALGLSACNDDTQPAPPPTPDDALTTTTQSPTPAPQAPTPDDTEPTSAPPATESPGADAAPTTGAGGIPEMPPEAMEDSETGAEAFALHYIDLINATGMEPQTGVLEPLATDDCASCDNHEQSVAYSVSNGDYLLEDTFIANEAITLLDPTGPTATVRIAVEQPEQTYYVDSEPIDRALNAATATLVFRLQWDRGWKVQEITVDDI